MFSNILNILRLHFRAVVLSMLGKHHYMNGNPMLPPDLRDELAKESPSRYFLNAMQFANCNMT